MEEEAEKTGDTRSKVVIFLLFDAVWDDVGRKIIEHGDLPQCRGNHRLGEEKRHQGGCSVGLGMEQMVLLPVNHSNRQTARKFWSLRGLSCAVMARLIGWCFRVFLSIFNLYSILFTVIIPKH